MEQQGERASLGATERVQTALCHPEAGELAQERVSGMRPTVFPPLPNGPLSPSRRRGSMHRQFVTESVTVRGWIAGRMWWPTGAPATLFRHAKINPNAGMVRLATDPHPDLRSALAAILETGDLQHVGFLPETLQITVVRRRVGTGRTVERRERTWTVRGRCWETDDVFCTADLVAAVEDCEETSSEELA